MDTAALERVYGAFQDFHAYFSPHFGRWESRERARDYLQALLVQGPDRRNAENLSEAVGVGCRRGRCSGFSPRLPGMMTE